MMHGHEKSRSAIVAVSRRTKRSDPLRSRWSEGRRPRGMWPAAHAPDSAPHKRVTDAGSHTAAHSCRDTRGGTVWRKAARTDLCGGCEVTRIPTATNVCARGLWS